MIRFILLFLFSINLIGKESFELNLYQKILPAIFKKSILYIYVDKKKAKLIQESDKFKIVNECDEADLMLGKNFDIICINKPWFGTSYKVFKNEPNVFGAFYLRKGRPQLKFKKDILDDFNLTLPKKLERYVK